jgi:gamma-glutamyltranspeptidase / glutathione hydrolase
MTLAGARYDQQSGDPADLRAGEAGVATAGRAATETALAILRSGGNAVDAAVAAAFSLGVCEPSGSGLGGVSSVLVAAPGQPVTAIDAHSVAPAGASLDTVTRSQQRSGHTACTVPSMASVLGLAHARWGRLPWPDVLEPAIALALDGHRVSMLGRRQLSWVAPALARDPMAAEVFVPSGHVPKPGQLLFQPRLAATLLRLAEEGADDFYTGLLSRRIVAEMAATGGLITAEDLVDAGRPTTREPLTWRYRDLSIATMPPPGGGLPMLLALLAASSLADLVSGDAAQALLGALATRAAHAVRDELPYESSPTGEAGLGRLLDETIRQTRAAITHLEVGVPRPSGPSGVTRDRQREEPGDTTHLSITDSAGMTVSLTSSIQSLFGAKVASKLGFVWNNYLYTCPRRPAPYQLGPRCRPRSNAAPTIVLGERGQPVLALGAAGSRRITSSIVQVLSSVLVRDTALRAALDAPRVHATTSELWVERPLVKRLPAGAGPVWVRGQHDYGMGAVHAVQRHPDSSVSAAADPRREGVATTIPGPTRPGGPPS